MTVFRKAVVNAAAIAVIFALALSAAHAAGAPPPATMPVMPERGAPSSAAMPPIGDISHAGKSIGGLPAERILRSVRGAQASIAPPLRGEIEQNLYAKFSRSVVLIVTPEALGSGAIIGDDGTIVTNWHVVAGLKSVGVIFKPQNPDAEVKESDAVEAKVIRIDQIADLALIKVASIPSDAKIIALGDPAKLTVGTDVHAIGHPLGETWSYTKGIVSQIRRNFTWSYKGEGIDHRADVVQTQTPINPGNSGGPLFNDAGELVGISTFGSGEGALINFAIASNEVRRLLGEPADRLAPAAVIAAAPKPGSKTCEPAALDTHRTKKDDGIAFVIDSDCNGKADALLVIPDDKTKPVLLAVDDNENGKFEVIYVDKNRDQKFDVALYDIDEDGKTDLIGYDLNDNMEPGRVEVMKT